MRLGGSFVLKGDLCFSLSPQELKTIEKGYLVCEDGICGGAYRDLPERWRGLPLEDCGDKLIIPGLVDLHTHAPQYASRGLGLDAELIEWLSRQTFPEEARYRDIDYAQRAYHAFVEEVRMGPNTRMCVFATNHVPATLLLMDLLEASGLVCLVGKVNMDRHSDAALQEESAEASLSDTRMWLRKAHEEKHYANTSPILTPRFIPSCSDDLMRGLKVIQHQHGLPLQSHLAENREEVAWVQSLCPAAASYSEAYHAFGLFGGDTPTVMAHCVWVSDAELDLMQAQGVFVAHCPQSNMNLASGIAPVRKFLERGIPTGLGSDMSAGCHTSIFRAMTDAIQVSKLYWCLVDQACKPLCLEEAFYMGTMGGGAFFGETGSFLPGYEFDALVIDDSGSGTPNPLDISERLARLVYRPEACELVKKFVRGIDI